MRSGVAEGSQPNCVVPELEAVLGKTHRTEFGGVSNVDIDGNNALQIKGIGVVTSTFETLPVWHTSTSVAACRGARRAHDRRSPVVLPHDQQLHDEVSVFLCVASDLP